MREPATHFEQVPRAVIEKILAQQNMRAEDELEKTFDRSKPSPFDAKALGRPSSRG